MRILLKFLPEAHHYKIKEIYKVGTNQVLDVFVRTPKESESVMSNPLVIAQFGKTIGARLIRTWVTKCECECSSKSGNICGKCSPQLHRKMKVETALALEEYCHKYGITS